ncbi:hypothetical protein BH10PLA2_BH10PLA2_20890 [soil metagenome]
MSWYSRRSNYRNDYGYGGFAPYVPVGQKLAKAAKHVKQLAKKQGREPAPVKITGRNMASTYWGKAWCANLERYSDYSNRLPRGRTYARNGSVVDLQIKKGTIEAIVAGSEVYKITINIETLSKPHWTRIKSGCSQSISSLLDLMQGRFEEGVMQRLAHPTEGLFPHPKEIKMRCSCPDSAGLCKHLAAVLYCVGNRLDTAPEMLFTLRNVDHLELVSQAMAEGNLENTLDAGDNGALAGSDLGEMFGIDLDPGTTPAKPARKTKKPAPTKKPKAEPAKTARKTTVKTTRVVVKKTKITTLKVAKSSAQGAKSTKTAKTAAPRKSR